MSARAVCALTDSIRPLPRNGETITQSWNHASGIITLGVADLERSYRFYHEGLGFPTTSKPEYVVFFQTRGDLPCALPVRPPSRGRGSRLPSRQKPLSGNNSRLQCAHQGGDGRGCWPWPRRRELRSRSHLATPWAPSCAYFSDPDGYLWEVYWSENLKFNEGPGSLIID